MTEAQIKRLISEQARRATLARDTESRRAAGRKAWQTRIANLRKAISPAITRGE